MGVMRAFGLVTAAVLVAVAIGVAAVSATSNALWNLRTPDAVGLAYLYDLKASDCHGEVALFIEAPTRWRCPADPTLFAPQATTSPAPSRLCHPFDCQKALVVTLRFKSWEDWVSFSGTTPPAVKLPVTTRLTLLVGETRGGRYALLPIAPCFLADVLC